MFQYQHEGAVRISTIVRTIVSTIVSTIVCVSRILRTQLNVQCYVYGTTINVRVRVGAMCARCPMLS